MENSSVNLFVRAVGKLSGWFGVIGGVFLFLIVFAIISDFTVTKLHGMPLRFNADLLGVLSIYMILLPAAMALRDGKQVEVNMLFDRFPPKLQKVVALFGLIAALVVFIITAYNGYLLTKEGFVDGLKSNNPYGMKLWYSQSAVFVGISLLCLQLVAKIIVEISSKERSNK
jgi:TRAP-type mannitol/chloroaromatic compound transport system permease small subunit